MSTSSQLKHVTKYRPDIDGLRAFAVICVIIFHIWPKALPGGFVGVDIFFVISGFLITTIIMSEMINGTFSFAKFYTRRIKRIMPLCWTIVIIAYIAAWLILLPGDLINFSGSARAVGFYASNIFFIKHNNYFAISSNEIPLIHTWSLSVEEQFYLVWPILLFFIYKFTKNLNLLILTIIGIILLSLSFSIWCSHHKLVFGNYGFGYYSIFSRAYELSIGVLLALIFEKRKHSKDILCAINSLNSKFNLLSVIGVLLLFYSIFFITDGDQFPGYLALLPTFGAALIILTGTGTHRCIVNRILSHKVIVYIGLLSYSLYLFHWPILAYWHYENPGLTPDISQGIVIIIVTMLLSILGYLLIELPIKKMQLSMLSAIVLLQILPLTLFMTLRNKIYNNDGYIERLDDSFRTKPFFLKNMRIVITL